MKSLSRTNRRPRHMSPFMLALAGLAVPAVADIDFTQTVDDWWYNKYEWNAQTDTVSTARTLDPVGTVKRVCARVVQKNGSQVGTEIFETTMTKVEGGGGLVDRWEVAVPAGSIDDTDFWDASRLGVEIVECPPRAHAYYNSAPSPFGVLAATDYAALDVDEEPVNRRVTISPADWDDAMVRSAGFDFAVYAYQTGPGVPTVLNHVDELGLTTFSYDKDDAFGSGQPYDTARLRILGIKLDPSWNILGQTSSGLNFFQWNLVPGGGQLITDQGVFQILQVQPLVAGWQHFCPADLNQDGARDFFDVQQWLSAFSNHEFIGDWNGDGLFDFFDVQLYLQDFVAPCP